MVFVEFGALFDYRTTHRFDDRLLASSLLRNSSNDFLDYIYSALTDYTPDNVFQFSN